MKRVMMTVLIVVSMFVCLPSVWADVYAPAVGDNIVINYAPNYPSNWNGGPFTLTDQTTIQSYVTYCLTDTEYFTPGAQYKVTGYETDISTNVALLYYNVWANTGKIDLSTDQAKKDFQSAIWYFNRSDADSVNSNQGYLSSQYLLSNTSFWSSLTTLPSNLEVVAVNYGSDAQDQLGVKPVPIPAAFWLLGSGLIGLVGVRRRFKS
jgi:hypothetical protein